MKHTNALEELRDRIAKVEDGRTLFEGWRELLGFRIGWAKLEVALALCAHHGMNTDDCEIIMMQAMGITECHLHATGKTTFLALGKEHGFADPRGGTLFGEFREGRKEFTLVPERAKAGEMFEVGAGRIHAFFADQGGELTLIGVVTPKIKQEDRFDVVPFEYVRQDPYVVRRTITLPKGG